MRKRVLLGVFVAIFVVLLSSCARIELKAGGNKRVIITDEYPLAPLDIRKEKYCFLLFGLVKAPFCDNDISDSLKDVEEAYIEVYMSPSDMVLNLLLFPLTVSIYTVEIDVVRFSSETK